MTALEHWGYLAVLVGTFFEGETVLVAAALAAYHGHLALPTVALCAFAGSLAGDQTWFLVGRRLGRSWFARQPRFARRLARIDNALARWRDPVILGFRVLYGIRLLVPFVLGAGSITWRRFAVLNVVGAALWAGSVSIAGYYAGAALMALHRGLVRHEWALAGVLLTGAGAGVWWCARVRPWSRQRTVRE